MSVAIKFSNLEGSDPAPLYHRYRGQLQPQPSFLYLTENGEVSLDSDSAIGGAVTMDVWHHRTLRWSVSPYLSRESCMDLLKDQDVIALLERVHAGHEVEWNGSNRVGRLSDDAQEAREELQKLLDERYSGPDAEAQIWSAADWLTACGTQAVSRAWPEDEPLDDAVERLEAEARSDGIVLDGSVRDELLAWLEEQEEGDLSGEHLTAYEQHVATRA